MSNNQPEPLTAGFRNFAYHFQAQWRIAIPTPVPEIAHPTHNQATSSRVAGKRRGALGEAEGVPDVLAVAESVADVLGVTECVTDVLGVAEGLAETPGSKTKSAAGGRAV